jgi:hypothetical protein
MIEIDSTDLCTTDRLMSRELERPEENVSQAIDLSRIVNVITALMLIVAFALVSVIAYHITFGAEIYRRGQEHAAAEISMAAQQAGAAIDFQYEDDMLKIVLLRKKGSYRQARNMADRMEKQKKILSYNY